MYSSRSQWLTCFVMLVLSFAVDLVDWFKCWFIGWLIDLVVYWLVGWLFDLVFVLLVD